MPYYVYFNGDVVDSIGTAYPLEARAAGGRDGLGFGIHAERVSAEQYALDVYRDALALDGMTDDDVQSVGGVVVYRLVGDEPSDRDPAVARVKHADLEAM